MPHTHDRLCLTVETFIVHDGRVLLRMHDKYRLWLSIGGHIDPGEDPAEAALREVREEVGLSVTLHDFGADFEGTEPDFKRLIPPRYLNRHRVDAAHEHVAFVYVAASPTDAVKPTYADDRSDEWRWFSRDELDDPSYAIRDNIKFYAKAALDSLTRKGAAR